MASSLADDLQRALGAAYRVDRELGGGGMSRVFVADERSLGRQVVVKILPPDLVAGLSVDRFRRVVARELTERPRAFAYDSVSGGGAGGGA